jgi:ketosteroid isomerase-like protein
LRIVSAGERRKHMTGGRVVARYFEALENGDPSTIPELFATDCRVFRPELTEPLVGIDAIQGVVRRAHQLFDQFKATILDSIEEEDRVAVRVRHEAVYRGEWRTRIGTFDVAGKPTSWEAMALFRLRDGKIAEERVFRDELGMLLDVGAVVRAR